MKHKLIGTIFAVLFLLAFLPLPFTEGEQTMLFGWLPATLAYWWVLMVVNLVFVLWVCKSFVKHANEEDEKE